MVYHCILLAPPGLCSSSLETFLHLLVGPCCCRLPQSADDTHHLPPLMLLVGTPRQSVLNTAMWMILLKHNQIMLLLFSKPSSNYSPFQSESENPFHDSYHILAWDYISHLILYSSPPYSSCSHYTSLLPLPWTRFVKQFGSICFPTHLGEALSK